LWRKWKRSSFDSVAEISFTGTETSPKEIEPVQMDRAMPNPFPPGSYAKTDGSRKARAGGRYCL
jgi:hypothetical protein